MPLIPRSLLRTVASTPRKLIAPKACVLTSSLPPPTPSPRAGVNLSNLRQPQQTRDRHMLLPPAPLAPRPGRKRSAQAILEEGGEALPHTWLRRASSPPSPKRRRPHVAVRDRTVAATVTPSEARRRKRQRFLRLTRAMDRDSARAMRRGCWEHRAVAITAAVAEANRKEAAKASGKPVRAPSREEQHTASTPECLCGASTKVSTHPAAPPSAADVEARLAREDVEADVDGSAGRLLGQVNADDRGTSCVATCWRQTPPAAAAYNEIRCAEAEVVGAAGSARGCELTAQPGVRTAEWAGEREQPSFSSLVRPDEGGGASGVWLSRIEMLADIKQWWKGL